MKYICFSNDFQNSSISYLNSKYTQKVGRFLFKLIWMHSQTVCTTWVSFRYFVNFPFLVSFILVRALSTNLYHPAPFQSRLEINFNQAVTIIWNAWIWKLRSFHVLSGHFYPSILTIKLISILMAINLNLLC